MGSISDREQIQADADALYAAAARFHQHSYAALTNPERLALLDKLERVTRTLQTPSHQLINQRGAQADPAELGDKLPRVLADRQHITRGRGRTAHRRGRRSGPAPRADR